MNILVTGAAGFAGKNLVAALQNIRDGKDKTRPGLAVGEIYTYDIDTDPALLAEYAAGADFVFHLAGVNRPQDPAEFATGNVGALSALLIALRGAGNTCPVMLSSSIQACCEGRYDTDYGRSKKAAEDMLFAYGDETGARVLVYRFPNLFGKWGRPNYNSVIATFCYNTAHDLPLQINGRDTALDLLYIDDFMAEMLDALEGKEHRAAGGRYCAAPGTHRVTLGETADLLAAFQAQPATLTVPDMPAGSFAKKLYSTYLSYLPKEKVAFPLHMNGDNRGSFTELFRSEGCGQVSVNISKPGVTKGQHWHHSKWEFFVVVAGHGLIQQRKIGTDEVLNFEVSGERIEAVHMLPGYTHNIINLSEQHDLVTVMWANEPFDPAHPDTFFEAVE